MTVFFSDLFERTVPPKALTAKQNSELEKEFRVNRYLTRRRREEVAHELKLGEELVEAWFERRRLKYENEMKANEGSIGVKNAKGVSMQMEKLSNEPPADEQQTSGEDIDWVILGEEECGMD